MKNEEKQKCNIVRKGIIKTGLQCFEKKVLPSFYVFLFTVCRLPRASTFENEGTAQRTTHCTHLHAMECNAINAHHPTSTAPQAQNNGFLQRFDKYTCVPCVSYLYFKPFLGIWANIIPHPGFAAFLTTLSILKFYIIFFSDFFYFLSQRTLRVLFLFSNFAP